MTALLLSAIFAALVAVIGITLAIEHFGGHEAWTPRNIAVDHCPCRDRPAASPTLDSLRGILV